MTDKREPLSHDPFQIQKALKTRLTRRELMKYAGAGAGAVSLGAFLAACGSDDSGSGGGGGGEGGGDNPFAGGPNGKVNFANWPLYIDKAFIKAINGRGSPTLYAYEKQSGTEVNYQEVIQDNASFFGRIQPQLSAGQPTGWDIIVITNGRELTALIANDWLEELDTSLRPNFDANAAPFAIDPPFDPGNKYTMCWQSGVTGIVTNKDLTGGEVMTSWEDLRNPKYKSQIGMLKAEALDAAMVAQGVDPEASTPDDWRNAATWLQEQQDAGVVRNYYEQGYIDEVIAGNLAGCQAWSGDVLYYKLWESYDNLEFVVPDEGGLLWIDNMIIPKGAENPVDAMNIMDYYYDPRVATDVAEWVMYMSPVNGVQKLMAQDAKDAYAKGWDAYAKKLEDSANEPMLFPDQAMLDGLYNFRNLTTDDERQEWDAIFEPIIQ